VDQVIHEPHGLEHGCFECGIAEVMVLEPCDRCEEPVGRCIGCVESEFLGIREIGFALLALGSQTPAASKAGQAAVDAHPLSEALVASLCGLCGAKSVLTLEDTESGDELPLCFGCAAFLAERALLLEIALVEASAEFRKREMLAVGAAERVLFGFPVSREPAETAA